MAKNLRTLANQLRKNHGFILIPTFDDGISPGTIIDRNGWNDLTKIGHLSDDPQITQEMLGPIDGPTPCMLADFNRAHELTVGGALDLVQPTTASARAQFKRAKEAVASFQGPVTYSRSLLRLESLVEATSGFFDRAVGQALASRSTFLVFQVVRARLSFLFRGSGGAGVDLSSGPLKKVSSASLGAGWSWRNSATLESKKEIVVAVEMARYHKGKKRFMVKG